MKSSLSAVRLGADPIITPHMDSRMGDNLCGPSVIEVPEWVEGALGRYYLYFADHKGRYIRLAFADEVTGPWTMYEPGALDIAASFYPTETPPEPPLDQQPPWAKHMKGGYLYAHIASPDVHIDNEKHCIRMYFHGLLPNGDQETRLAVSSDGINFDVLEPLLGPPYFRAFKRDDWIYTVAWGGGLWRANNWHLPFIEGPQLIHYDPKEGIGEGFRHGETFVVDDSLFVLFTRMGDAPERLLYCEVPMEGDWQTWQSGPTQELLTPELDWEGADLPVKVSTMGAERERVRELRDPCVFKHSDGKIYLFYCGAGESAIGIAELEVTAGQ